METEPTDPETTVKTGDYRPPERGPRGHFAPGNKLASGNPNAKRMHELRRQFLEAIADGTIAALAKKLQVAALQGDMDATKLLFDYTLGRPSQAVELTGADGEPLGLNIGAVTTIVLNALSGPEHAEARLRIAADLMRLDDARDDDA